MVVSLQLGAAFHGFVDGTERLDLFRREGKFSRQFFAAVAGLNQLNDDTCRSGGDRHELDQAFSALDLTILDAQTLALQRAKELFDDPALLVPGDDPPSVCGGGDRMSSQEQPMNGLSALRRVQLDDFHEADFDALRQVVHTGTLRPLEHDGSEAHGEMGLATAAIHSLRQIDHRLVAEAGPLDRLIKRAAIDQRMVVHGTRQKVDLVTGRQRPVCKEIPLAVIDDGDHASGGQNVAALFGRRHPARQLLVDQGSLVVRDFDRAFARPHAAASEPETDPAVGIDRHHGMQREQWN